MSSRATFITGEYHFQLSESFLEKWKDKIHTNDGKLPISSKRHGSIYGFWHAHNSLEKGLMPDLQAEMKRLDLRGSIEIIFFEEDYRMLTWFTITKDSISEGYTMG